MKINKALLAALAFVPVTAFAQDASAPIRMIIGFPPGGNIDFIGRTLAMEASKHLDRTIIVESRPGAGGAVGAEAVARATPDGSVLLLASSANAILPALNKNLRYDALSDFEWVNTFTQYPLVVTVKADSPFKTFSDLINEAKKKPEAVSYSSAGIGSAFHLAGTMLERTTGTDLLHVGYKGEAAAIVALLGSQVDFTISTGPTALPRVKSGELRALAITSNTRWPSLPEIPTIAESGYKDFHLSSWVGLAAPGGTPPKEVERIHNAFLKAQQNPQVRKQVESTGGETYTLTPAQMRDMVKGEIEKWKEFVAEAGISVD